MANTGFRIDHLIAQNPRYIGERTSTTRTYDVDACPPAHYLITFANGTSEKAYGINHQFAIECYSSVVSVIDNDGLVKGLYRSLSKPQMESTFTTAILPSVTEITPYWFYNATNLTYVSFGNITSIGSSAFYNCGLVNWFPMDYVEYIGTSAFGNATDTPRVMSFPNLKELWGENHWWGTPTEELYFMSNQMVSLKSPTTFDWSHIKHIYVPSDLLSSYMNTYPKIWYMFDDTPFPSVGILTWKSTNGVTYQNEISSNRFHSSIIPSFYYLRSATEISDNGYINYINGYLMEYNYYRPESINLSRVVYVGTSAFDGRSELKYFNFDNCLSIDSYAFASTGFSSISFGKELTIGDYAFYSCKSLNDVWFGKFATMRPSYAFSYCPSTMIWHVPASLYDKFMGSYGNQWYSYSTNGSKYFRDIIVSY